MKFYNVVLNGILLFVNAVVIAYEMMINIVCMGTCTTYCRGLRPGSLVHLNNVKFYCFCNHSEWTLKLFQLSASTNCVNLEWRS